jgi:hypothetical protein
MVLPATPSLSSSFTVIARPPRPCPPNTKKTAGRLLYFQATRLSFYIYLYGPVAFRPPVARGLAFSYSGSCFRPLTECLLSLVSGRNRIPSVIFLYIHTVSVWI